MADRIEGNFLFQAREISVETATHRSMTLLDETVDVIAERLNETAYSCTGYGGNVHVGYHDAHGDLAKTTKIVAIRVRWVSRTPRGWTKGWKKDFALDQRDEALAFARTKLDALATWATSKTDTDTDTDTDTVQAA